MTRLLPAILAMAIIVTASNILVQFLMGSFLTWGAITYPFAFLVTDLTNRYQGLAAARKVVLAGFATGVVCSLIGSLIEGGSGPLVTLRVAVGSGTAFLVAQLTDVTVFHWYRRRSWWRAPFISTLIGSTLDTILFFTIAFWSQLTVFGPQESAAAAWASEAIPFLGFGKPVPLWISLAVADWCVKIGLAVFALVPFRLMIRRIKAEVA